MINWQPIETAPKDRTILLFMEGVIIQGKWNRIVSFKGEVYEKWSPARLSSHGCGCCGSDDEEPTHWAEINLP